jgi:hypothetical protein
LKLTKAPSLKQSKARLNFKLAPKKSFIKCPEGA